MVEEEEDTPETGRSEIYPRGRGQGGCMEAEEVTDTGTTQEIQLGAQGSLGYPVGGGLTLITKVQYPQHLTEHQ